MSIHLSFRVTIMDFSYVKKKSNFSFLKDQNT